MPQGVNYRQGISSRKECDDKAEEKYEDITISQRSRLEAFDRPVEHSNCTRGFLSELAGSGAESENACSICTRGPCRGYLDVNRIGDMQLTHLLMLTERAISSGRRINPLIPQILYDQAYQRGLVHDDLEIPIVHEDLRDYDVTIEEGYDFDNGCVDPNAKTVIMHAEELREASQDCPSPHCAEEDFDEFLAETGQIPDEFLELAELPRFYKEVQKEDQRRLERIRRRKAHRLETDLVSPSIQ